MRESGWGVPHSFHLYWTRNFTTQLLCVARRVSQRPTEALRWASGVSPGWGAGPGAAGGWSRPAGPLFGTRSVKPVGPLVSRSAGALDLGLLEPGVAGLARLGRCLGLGSVKPVGWASGFSLGWGAGPGSRFAKITEC